MGLAAHRTPVLVELKPGESPVRIKQYPMSQEAQKGIQPHIRRLRSLGVLVPCQSAWNTPLLPVKKPHTNDCRPVQDLREVNKRVPTMTIQLPDPGDLVLPDQPKYSQEELQRIKKLPMAQEIKGWWYTPNKELVLPDRLGVSILEHMHRSTHMGARKFKDLIRHAGIKIHQQDTKIEQVVSARKTCQLTNARATSNKKGTRLRGTRPGAQWEVDFTEVKPGKYGFKYLLVFTDTFSGWVEAYPTKHETAQTVAKKLLENILPSGLQRAHEDIWPRLRAIYEAGPTPTPHRYRPGDWVYVKRHHRETLEPRWKGPYIVVLTTPTALKVDGIATWVHHTHVRPADPSSIRKDFVTRWAISRDQHNPLKLKLQRIRPN
ncbi:uncharacterized protein LOC144617304 [Panthera onca]